MIGIEKRVNQGKYEAEKSKRIKTVLRMELFK